MKKFTRIVAIIAAMMMLAGIASAADYTATIAFADADWSNQDWATAVSVTGDGTYTITTTGGIAEETPTSEGAVVFCIDITGVTTDLLAAHGLTNDDITADTGAGKAAGFNDAFGIVVTVDSIKVDGTEVAVDNSKVLVGDLEDKGNLRIEIYNEYGDTKNTGAAADLDALVFSTDMEITFTIKGLDTALTGVKYDASADTTTDDTATETPSTDEQPATGDATNIVVLAVVAVIALAGVVVSKKRA
ncbi:MAG: LPXTG cell wall anchor domain-containing protein [Lachnospiraceae bacterium]|nr:LPXTG cell wall anchor domain-containing protein [Lachnospiraceae bacterium]